MADGFNQVRAIRITEIMTDFRNLQNYIASIRAAPSAEEYNEDGFVLLRQCEAEAKSLLNQGFQMAGAQSRDEEQQKIQLRRIIVDASVRRHKAHKIYLRATAALRWVNSRAAVLQGQRAHAGHAAALLQIRNALRTELAGVTDQRIELALRSADTNAGKWLLEDPSLATIQSLLREGSP